MNPKISLLPIALLCLLPQIFYCCKEANKNSQDKKSTTADSKNFRKPASYYNDTLFIQERAAVFFTPDSIQLLAVEKVLQRSVFESITHENFFQMRNARLVLQKYWPGINIIETSRHRWLAFANTINAKTVIDLNQINDISGIFLFDPKKNPELIDMMNIDTALGFYFEK